MKRRLGITGWGGSRPYNPWSKTLTTTTIGIGHNPGTTSGALFILPCNNWNDPTADLGTLVGGSGTSSTNRHPMHHNTAIADGYNVVQVLSWKAALRVNWILADTPTADFFVAYTFRGSALSEVTLTAGTASAIERMEMMTNSRWTLKHYRAVQGLQEVRPNSEDIIINVPNVFKYCENISRGTEIVTFGNGAMSHLIADVNSASGPPAVELFCTVVIMTESGQAMAIDSVAVTVSITQKVKIMRNWTGTSDLNEGEPDVHS